ncbi:predicted protein [Lichtheimia corymbifera JMRC:FSU:9682]|uniref:Uncharacterized protein n=1 Tax=Lichtheimia corymbifera JMRC:FSU:9682 TaxID=1263082 RepID=A0A068RDM4_9FUNG|nr:predicted protein [Lichtheimia corymbifera JMRC:FSU:9682]
MYDSKRLCKDCHGTICGSLIIVYELFINGILRCFTLYQFNTSWLPIDDNSHAQSIQGRCHPYISCSSLSLHQNPGAVAHITSSKRRRYPHLLQSEAVTITINDVDERKHTKQRSLKIIDALA